MKEKIFAVSAGVTLGIACVSSCFSPPTEVYADAGSFAGAVDYICSLEGAEAAALNTAGGGYVTGALIGIYLCTRNPISTGSTVNASSIAFCSGTYYNGDLLKRGVLVACSGNFSGVDGFDFAYSDDFDLYLTGSGIPTNFLCEVHDGSGFRYYSYLFTPTNSGASTLSALVSNRRASSGCLTGTYSCSFGRSYMGVRLDITGSSPQLNGTNLSTFLSGGDFNGGSSRPRLLGDTIYGRLPSGDIDFANPDLYVNNILRPYIEETYPEYIYLLPDPEPEPIETLDPSETMPGLPVIQLPTVPAPDYDLELPEKMLEGAGFWFTALTEVLDEMGWLAIVIVLAVIAIVLYYVF